jgi:pimeloyl-ACP methyl ester carboxylesterase
MLPTLAAAQEFEDVKPSKPLELGGQGSFFIGGNTHQVDSPYAGTPGGSMINQMYVQFQLPTKDDERDMYPIVFVHGCCLSSKTWETTPDGRMGWYEYFLRKGFKTYMADQVGRARSGFDALQYQKVRFNAAAPPFTDQGGGAGCINPGVNSSGCEAPAAGGGTTNPNILIATDMFAWNVFRYGPPCTAPCGAFTSPPTIFPYADQRFPMQTALNGGSLTFYKQVIPDMTSTLGSFGPDPAVRTRPTPARMAVLAKKLKGAILVGHSQSSAFPTRAALQDPTGVKGIIQLETGCFANLTTAEIDILKKIPILVMEGDHYVQADGVTPQVKPPAACVTQEQQLKAAGGNFTYIHLPAIGIFGNSHMFMQDNNNLKIADIIIKWIDKNVKFKKKHDHDDDDDDDHHHH